MLLLDFIIDGNAFEQMSFFYRSVLKEKMRLIFYNFDWFSGYLHSNQKNLKVASEKCRETGSQ